MKFSRTNTLIGWGIIAASFAVLFRRVWLMELDPFKFDDAFMFMRYADNLLSGHGFTLNAGDPAVFGCTSILYTYLIAIGKFVFGGLLTSTWILVGTALLFGVAFIVELQGGMYQTVRSDQMKDRMVLLLLTVPFLLLPLLFSFHISTGMETTLSLFLHTGFIYSVMRYGHSGAKEWKWLLTAGMTTYLIYLVRPDNAIVAALFPVLYMISQKKYKHLIYLVGLATLLLAVDSIIKYAVFGDLLPLSYYTKKSGFTAGYTAKYYWNPIKYLTQFVAYLLPYFLLIFVLVKRKHRMLLISFFLPVTVTFAYFFTFDQIMGFNGRLYFPFIPYFIIPALLLLDEFFLENADDRQLLWKPNVLMKKFAFLILFLFLTVFSKDRFISMYEHYATEAGKVNVKEVPNLESRKYNREKSIEKLNELLKKFPDDLVIAATEHGFLSGDNPHKRIVDLSGLHNYSIARTGYDDALLASEKPDLIWMPHQDLTVLHHEVRTGKYFREHYDYISNVYAFGFAVHKESRYYEQLKQAAR